MTNPQANPPPAVPSAGLPSAVADPAGTVPTSLSSRANLTIGLVFLLLLLGTITVLYFSLNGLTRQLATEQLEQESAFLQRQWQQSVRTLLQDTRLLALNRDIVSLAQGDGNGSVQYFLGWSSLSSQFKDVEMVTVEGNELVDLSFRSDLQYLLAATAQTAAVQRDVRLGKERTLVVHMDDQTMLIAALPVRNRVTGQVLAYLYTGHPLDADFLADIRPLSEHLELFLFVDGALAAYTLEAESAGERANKSHALNDFMPIMQAQMPSQVQSAPTVSDTVYEVDNVPHALGFVPLLLENKPVATVSLLVGLDSLFAFQNELLWWLLTIFALLTLGGVGLMYMFMRRFVLQPLQTLQNAASAIAMGDYAQRVVVARNDEIGQLGNTFNTMAESLQQMHNDLEDRIRQRTVQLQAALKDVESARSRFDLAVRGSNDGIWDIDLLREEIYLSPRWKEMLGYRDDELANTTETVYSLIHPDDRDRVFQVAADYLERRSPNYVVEYRICCKDGNYRWILTRGMALRDATGKPYRLAGSNTDITLLKEAVAEANAARRAAEQANQMKSQFLANMSHELRTPLNSIINFTRIVSSGMRGPVTDEQVDYLERVRLSGEHLLGLINDILDLSKIEAGRMELHLASISLEVLVKSTMSTAIGLIKGKPVELRSDIEPDLPNLMIDRTRIRQVLLNLLSNAAKFTDKGTITVAVRRKGAMIEVSVADTGIGIPKDKQRLVFEEFRQVDEGSDRMYQGTGLGLAICRQLVALHGGQIWVESQPGQGSTFFFTLPVPVDSNAPQISLSPVEVDALPPPQRPIILTIDDDRSMIEIVQSYLQPEGFIVYGVTDSRLALDEARRVKPVLIILDILMSHCSGWEVLASLKSSPDLRHIPVLICTIVDERKLGIQLGASAYLPKPIDRDALYNTVRQLVAGKAHILLVDDDADVRETLTTYLGAVHQYHITAVEDGQQALEQMERTLPDLLILDLMMPRMDGFAVLEEMSRSEQLHAVPVIVLTAHDPSAGEREYLAQRVRTILTKASAPPETVLKQVRALLNMVRVTSPATIATE